MNFFGTLYNKLFNRKIHIKIDGNWYDVTEFNKIHPGGSILSKYHNKDASTAFHKIPKHKNFVGALEQFKIHNENNETDGLLK